MRWGALKISIGSFVTYCIYKFVDYFFAHLDTWF